MHGRFGKWTIAAALAGTAGTAIAQEAVPPPISFEGYEITAEPDSDEIRIDEYLDRRALILRGASVWLQDVEFTDGVIEYDIAFEDRFGFTGVSWRATSFQDREYFYLRTGNSGFEDASQYAPVMNGIAAWQIYSDENAQVPLGFTYTGWNHVRVVVQGDRAAIHFNGSAEPVLRIADLKTDIPSGMVGFQSDFPDAEIRIANITVRPLRPGESVAPSEEIATMPEGIIPQWSVSSPFSETSIDNDLVLPDLVNQALGWQHLATETSGIANFSRRAPRTRDADTVIAAARIQADGARRARLTFGYSDRVRLYLNGALIFDANAGWRTRDGRFLGTVGLFDAVTLDLRDGENVLMAAVSETFGGWAWTAAIANRDGLEITPYR